KKVDEENLFQYSENKRLYLFNIRNDYYREFGDLELDKLYLLKKEEKCKIILHLIQNHPGYSNELIEELTNKELAEYDLIIKELKKVCNRSNFYIDNNFFPGSRPSGTLEMLRDYKKRYDKLKKKIVNKLHPDARSRQPTFIEEMNKTLDHLWIEYSDLVYCEQPFSLSPTMMLYHIVDIDKLKLIYIKVCECLKITPDELEPGNRLDFMIHNGSCSKDIIQFMEDDIERLELQLANFELTLNQHKYEDQIIYYEKAMEDIEYQKSILQDEIKELENKCLKMEKEISFKYKKNGKRKV
ncbi:hypothetical protein N9164_09840, partial [Draconibacterium sp.]|nr:hypothetical protein [Draconibacterium sp.]